MSALRKAQYEYDNRLPPPVSEDDLAEVEWIDANADRLLAGYRVDWGYRPGDKGEVTQAHFAKAVQDHVNQRQIDGLDEKDALGQLVIAASGFASAGSLLDLAIYLVGGKQALKEIAVELLKPHAEQAVAAQQEQDRLERECGF
ncbi:hypothetical protein PF66_06383 [Pseudomonas asplenii]|uniref:Uncharacterized protein n=2 Tax=Pseudomonas asplenii TaxID=53407 RepID=A0A0N0E0Z0_9PSED|nr:hypothetical protein PF66_06383 [Pseudomonas fuscovaginae]